MEVSLPAHEEAELPALSTAELAGPALLTPTLDVLMIGGLSLIVFAMMYLSLMYS